MNKNIINLGFWAAIICMSAFIIWIISFVGIAMTSPLFMWENFESYIQYVNSNSQFFQYLAKSFMIIFALAYLILSIVFQEMANNDKKILAKIGLTFGIIFTMLTTIHYFVQISAVRFALETNELAGIEHFLQAKPTSVMSSINMLGWTLFLGLSSLFMFFSFNTKELTKGIKTGFLINAISCLLAGFGFLFQIDLITFLFINLGLGGGMLLLSISSSRYFFKLKSLKKLLIIALCMFAFSKTSTISAKSINLSTSQNDTLGLFLQSLYSANQPGAVVTIAQGTTIKFHSAYGLADIKNKTSMRKDMVFPIASMTKAYTAVAIMHLQEKKLLNVEDNLPKYFPDLTQDYSKVKIKHLLSNTSGILSYNRMPEYGQIRDKSNLKLNQMIDFIKDKPLSFSPGTKFRYSNSNYLLLTKIIEKLGNMSYPGFLTKNIFKKADLKNTFFKEQKSKPTGYQIQGDTFKENSENTYHTYGAGMLYATSVDFVRFLIALNSEKIITQKNLNYLYSVPLMHNDGRPDEYAHGFWITKIQGQKVIKLEGYCSGFHTNALYFPDKNIAITVFPNSSGYPSPVNMGFIAEWIYRFYDNQNVKIYSPISLSNDILKQYEGVYQIDSTTFRQVFAKDNKLYTMRTAGQMLEAKPYSKNKFFYPNTFTEFEFIEKGNNITMKMLDDYGNVSTAFKTDQQIRKAIDLDINQLEKFTGKYEKRFKIFIKEDKLMFTNGFHIYQLFPLNVNKFFSWHEDAVFLFKEIDGKFTLTYSIGNFSMTVKKMD
ncbi:MAG: hypothetical protein B6I20_07950 [Bacteroidetes bacterium 4572_117]|nr:MAG: hypothetical protein B6I20_07950 [Bacteroidetes bacterium 4572_117]